MILSRPIYYQKTKEVFAVDAMNWYGGSESGVPSKAARIESGQHQGGGESNVFFLLFFVVFCLYYYYYIIIFFCSGVYVFFYL